MFEGGNSDAIESDEENGVGEVKARGRRSAKEALVTRLRRAEAGCLFVEVSRRQPGAEKLEGFVVGVGGRWVSLALFDDEWQLDGWALLPLRELLSVTLHPDGDRAEIRSLKARGLWPLRTPSFELDDADGAARSALQVAGVIGASTRVSDRYLVGAARFTEGSKMLRMRLVSSEGRWLAGTVKIPLSRLRRINCGGRYEDGCLRAASVAAIDGVELFEAEADASVKDWIVREGSLVRALELVKREQVYVRIVRNIPEAAVIDGYVTDVSASFVAIARLDMANSFDSWSVVRFGDIVRIRTPRHHRLQRVVPRLIGEWPPPSVGVPIDALRSILGVSTGRLVGLYTEYPQPEVWRAGVATVLDEQTIALHEVDTQGRPKNRPTLVDIDDITRIDLGGNYLTLLSQVIDMNAI